jgi:hypothetical protein
LAWDYNKGNKPPIRKGGSNFYDGRLIVKTYDASLQGTEFGQVSLDYLTLTSYDDGFYYSLASLLPDEHKKAIGIPRYRGFRCGQIFLGQGEQQKRTHYLAQAEGIGAHFLYQHSRNKIEYEVEKLNGKVVKWEEEISERVRCTRFDIQISVQSEVDIRLIKDLIENSIDPFRRRGPRPSVELVESDRKKAARKGRGMGKTCYVGSYDVEDGYFIRIYEKEFMEVRHIRLEVVFKGDEADKQYRLMSDKHNKNLLYSAIKSLPESVEYLFDGHLHALKEGEAVKLRLPEPLTTEERRAHWYRQDVARSIARLEDKDAIEHALRTSLMLVRILEASLTRHNKLSDLSDLSDARAEYHKNLALQRVHADSLQRQLEEETTGRTVYDQAHYNHPSLSKRSWQIEQGAMSVLLDMLDEEEAKRVVSEIRGFF